MSRDFENLIHSRLDELKRRGRWRTLELSRGVSFTDNDYLGLSDHPLILSAGHRALDIFGAGSRGSRLLGGHSRIFQDAEDRIAAFFGAPSALFFSTGYLANLGVVRTLGELCDEVVSDEKAHASLIDACLLTRKPKTILPHQQWERVPQTLSGKRVLLIAESLYSMDGDVFRKEALLEAARHLGAFVVLDEAHAAGVFTESGRGFQEGTKDWGQLAVVVTFGKAFGVAGAAVLCSRELRELLVNAARSFIYTTAPSPAVPAMVMAALDVASQESWRREELWDRARAVRAVLSEVPVASPALVPSNSAVADRWNDASPIIPFFVPGDDRALRFCENMREKGIYLRAIRYPTVPEGTERIRISLSLRVTRENTETMAKELVKSWTAFFS